MLTMTVSRTQHPLSSLRLSFGVVQILYKYSRGGGVQTLFTLVENGDGESEQCLRNMEKLNAKEYAAMFSASSGIFGENNFDDIKQKRK